MKWNLRGLPANDCPRLSRTPLDADNNEFQLQTVLTTSKPAKFIHSSSELTTQPQLVFSLAQPLKKQSLSGYKSLFAQISKSLSKTRIDDYVQPNALIMKSMMCKFVWLPNYCTAKSFCACAFIIKLMKINLNSPSALIREAMMSLHYIQV